MKIVLNYFENENKGDVKIKFTGNLRLKIERDK